MIMQFKRVAAMWKNNSLTDLLTRKYENFSRNDTYT